jgi:UDP-2,3-diacylglucosamine pyrophosphatase LpxH
MPQTREHILLGRQVGVPRVLEEWGVARLEAEEDLDLVVLGHTHSPTVREVGTGRWYVNSGDWVLNHTYVVLEAGAPPRLSEWGTPR